MRRTLLAAVVVVALAGLAGATARKADAVLPPGNAVEQWDKIAEDTVVGSGAFQIEGFVYMAYVTDAMYRTTAVSLPGSFADAAVVEAAYQTLSHYFPGQAATLASLHQQAMAAIPNDLWKFIGTFDGQLTASRLIAQRQGDGLVTPIGSTSTFPTVTPGPGVWRLTPPAYLPPQTPWAGSMRPFILQRPDQFLPPPPPSLSSPQWVAAFNEIKAHGSSTNPNTTETSTAEFWTANAVRQYNEAARELATARNLGDAETARLLAMVDMVGADAGIAVMNAKYHYLFWRPVSAIDPTSVRSSDGFGPAPGFDDGNPATVEQPGWRPLLTTPNHPEYPAAHGSVTSAEASVFADFLGTNNINLDIHGFDPAGPAGNMNAVHHFATTADLRTEIVNARVWGGLHYRFSGEAGVTLGGAVAQYDLSHGFAGPLH
jgi:hypothetical protein